MFGSRKDIANSTVTVALREQGLLPPDRDNPGEFEPYQGRFRGDFFKHNDFFLRDAAQGEDGKNVESEVGDYKNTEVLFLLLTRNCQVWGRGIDRLPGTAPTGVTPQYRPVMITHDWPLAHKEPFKNKVFADDNPRVRYLEDPTAPTWNLITAIPVSQYAKFFRKEWWASEYEQGGFVNLRLTNLRHDGKPLKTVLRVGGEHQDAEIIRAFRNRHTVRWMLTTASELLREAGYFVLERYLRLATFQAASAKILRRRLFYDRNNWDNKFSQLYRRVEDARGWYEAIANDTRARLDPGMFTFDTFVESINELQYLSKVARNGISMLKETLRVGAQESAYFENLAHLYLQQNARQRAIIRKDYMAPLFARLQALQTRLRDLAEGLYFQGPSGMRWDIEVLRRVTSESVPPPGPPQEAFRAADNSFRDDMDELVRLRGCLHSLAQHIDEASRLLVEEPDPAVAEAIHLAQRNSELRRAGPAALRALRQLDHRAVDRAVAGIAARWLALLNYHPDLQDPLLGVRQARRWADASARRGDMMTEARSMLQNEEWARRQRALDKEAEIPNVPEDPTVETLRTAIGNMAGSGAFAAGDRAFLLGHWTVGRIQWVLDGGQDDLTPEERKDNVDEPPVFVSMGMFRRLGL